MAPSQVTPQRQVLGHQCRPTGQQVPSEHGNPLRGGHCIGSLGLRLAILPTPITPRENAHRSCIAKADRVFGRDNLRDVLRRADSGS